MNGGKGIRGFGVAAVAMATGAMLGWVAGLAIRSDNLPFMAILGAVAGGLAALGLAAVFRRL